MMLSDFITVSSKITKGCFESFCDFRVSSLEAVAHLLVTQSASCTSNLLPALLQSVVVV